MKTNTEKIQADTIAVLERKNKELLKSSKIILIVSFMLLISVISTFIYFSFVQGNLNNKILESEEAYHDLFINCNYYNSPNEYYPIEQGYNYPMLNQEEIINQLNKNLKEQINLK